MQISKREKHYKTWGTIPIGASRVPIRWIVLWAGFAGWLAITLVKTGPAGITAFAFNVSIVIGLLLIALFTRTVPLRTILMMFFAGGLAVGIAALVEQIFNVTFLEPLRSSCVPAIEEVVKVSPILLHLYRTRKFSSYTYGLTDFILMGAAVGAGFGVVNDSFIHVNRNWSHHIQWLPTADYVNNQFLVAGHAIWTALAAFTIGLYQILSTRNRNIALVVGALGVVWATYDHFAAIHFLHPHQFISSSVKLFTVNGFASVYLFAAAVVTALLADYFILIRWSLKAKGFKLPKRGQLTEGFAGLWDFVLDRRRLAFANFRRHFLKNDQNASMTVAILSQSLLNYHNPPKMARILEAMSDAPDKTVHLTSEDAEREDLQEELLTTHSLRLPDQYQIISRISLGGMGAIYKGRHRKTDAALAIKVLHPHVASKESNIHRFEREAQAASKLNHPNLVVIHDYGLTQDEVPYLIMELIEGQTLRAEIGKNNGLPPRQFFDIFDQICDALEHAHKRGVIHRDIKPSNILLMKSDVRENFVKLVDFGIAKVVASQDLGEQELTQTGDIVGSPLYMSPEQCVGDELDARTDIYSLGCVMYEAIAGSPPFMAPNAVKTIFKHVNVKPDPVSVTNPKIAIPPQLEQIIFKTLEKKPQDRFATMEDLKVALRQCRQMMAM